VSSGQTVTELADTLIQSVAAPVDESAAAVVSHGRIRCSLGDDLDVLAVLLDQRLEGLQRLGIGRFGLDAPPSGVSSGQTVTELADTLIQSVAAPVDEMGGSAAHWVMTLMSWLFFSTSAWRDCSASASADSWRASSPPASARLPSAPPRPGRSPSPRSRRPRASTG
jgi:hypothetical protein